MTDLGKFHSGGTIILEIEVTNSSTGEFVDPVTSMRITVTDSYNGVEVDNQDMVKDATGKYHYDYTPATTAERGRYRVIFTDTDGSRVSKAEATFELE